ncbi:MAG: phenylalanine--tRNA ligase subunit alpha, partial [Clostridiaceae bacterium]
MKEKLSKIKENAFNELKQTASKEVLEQIRVKYLGKKGELTSILKGMKDLSNEERP